MDDAIKELDSNVGGQDAKASLANAAVLGEGLAWAEKYFAAKPEAPLGAGFAREGKEHLAALVQAIEAGDFDAASNGVRGSGARPARPATKPTSHPNESGIRAPARASGLLSRCWRRCRSASPRRTSSTSTTGCSESRTAARTCSATLPRATPKAASGAAREIEELYGLMEKFFEKRGNADDAVRWSREGREFARRGAGGPRGAPLRIRAPQCARDCARLPRLPLQLQTSVNRAGGITARQPARQASQPTRQVSQKSRQRKRQFSVACVADDISLWTSCAMRVFLQRSQGDFVSVR